MKNDIVLFFVSFAVGAMIYTLVSIGITYNEKKKQELTKTKEWLADIGIQEQKK